MPREFIDPNKQFFVGQDGPAPSRPLPNIAPNGQATYSPAQGAGNPIDNFNLRLMEMLQQAQAGGQTNAPLYAQANNLANMQTENAMAPASELGIDNLRPGDALSARRNQEDLYDPEIKSLNDRISLNNESIKKFESALKTAKEYGEEYAKSVRPDEETINAVKEQMAAGFVPSATVIEKMGKYLTSADWNALASAKNADDGKSSDQKEYDQAKSEGYSGNLQSWLDRNQNKPSETEQKDSRKNAIIDDAKNLPRGGNGMANPNDYLDKASEYIKAGGSANEFIAATIPSRILSPSDAEYVRTELNRATPGSSSSGW